MTTQNFTHWYFIESDKALGPLTLDQMRAGTAQGKIKPDSLVCPAGEQTWSPANNWPMLFPPKPPATRAEYQSPPLPPSTFHQPPAQQLLPVAMEVHTSDRQDSFKIVHWVSNGILTALFISRAIYFFHDKQVNLLTLQNFVFNNDFSWTVLLPQMALGLTLAYFLQPRAKWMLIAAVVILFFSFVGSFALTFEAFRQRRTQSPNGVIS